MSLIQLPLHVSEKLHNVKVHLWALTEGVEVLQTLLPDTTVLSRPPYVDFKAESRQREWLAVRALLSQVVPSEVTIDYKDSGKPFLVPGIAELSISHTRGTVALALSPLPVGIDVETAGNRAFRLRSHFLLMNEMDSQEDEFDETMAVLMWSAKESVYKLCGKPGLEFKEGIKLYIKFREPDHMRFEAEVAGFSKKVKVAGFVLEDFVLTVAQFVEE